MNLFGKFVVVLWRFNLFFAQRASGIKSTAWQDKTTLKGTRARYVTQFWAILKLTDWLAKKLSEGEPQRTQKNDEGLLKHSACFLFVFGVLEEWRLISWRKFYRGI